MVARGTASGVKVGVLVLVAMLLAFQATRSAAVADRERRPALAEALWPQHPAVLKDRALLSIASAAARGQPVPPATRADVRRIAEKAPLSPDPFVIEGAIAQTQGKSEAAERMWLAARDRDPRSRAARFLLADRFLRTGRVSLGLMEMQALVGLQSRGVEAFGPALVAYARQPGAIPELRAFFRKYPRAEAGVLTVLATDPANADLVLALASNLGRPEPDWRANLVSALVSAGNYPKAYASWLRVSRLRAAPGLFNAGFADIDAPRPFNWQFTQLNGVAEPDGKGGLDVLYYGREDAVLASQLLLLPPGQYRLAMTVEGAGGETAVAWRLRCADGRIPLPGLALKPSAAAAALTVPDKCEAQWLELRGVAGESPRITEVKLRNLRLEGPVQ
jgi:hypothetical protein